MTHFVWLPIQLLIKVFFYFFHKVDLEKNRKHDLMSDVDNDWFLFNLFQFAIVTRIQAVYLLLIFYHIQVPDVLYIQYLYNIYKELTEESRVLTSIQCGILFRLFDFYFSILHNFLWILSCIAWKVFLKTKTILYAVGWGLHRLKNYEGKFKAHNLAEVIFVLNSRDQ